MDLQVIDSVSFINNHHHSTKKLSVGSIKEILQGRRPESLNFQILGALKHQTDENKYRLKLTDGRDLIDEAILDSSEILPPNKFSIIQISDRDTPANVTKHQVKPIGEKYALVINHFTLLRMAMILVISSMSQSIIHHDVLDISKFQMICNVSMLA